MYYCILVGNKKNYDYSGFPNFHKGNRLFGCYTLFDLDVNIVKNKIFVQNVTCVLLNVMYK